MRSVILALVISSSTAFCATTELEAFDYKQCMHWSISSDTGMEEPEAYRTALKTAKGHPNASVFLAFAERRDGSFTKEKFVVCSFQTKSNGSQIYCLPHKSLPFSGATYASAKHQPFIGTEILACISGCDNGAPDSIHIISQDIFEQSAFEAAEKSRSSKFEKLCKKK